MKLDRWIVFWGLTLGLVGACGKAGSGMLGGETHWRTSCDEAAECGPDLACICGVCSSSCSDDAGCGGFGSDARCGSREATAYASSCTSSQSEPERLCVRSSDLTV